MHYKEKGFENLSTKLLPHDGNMNAKINFIPKQSFVKNNLLKEIYLSAIY